MIGVIFGATHLTSLQKTLNFVGEEFERRFKQKADFNKIAFSSFKNVFDKIIEDLIND